MSDSSEERVGMHITSTPDETNVEQPATHGASERIQLPLRLVVASDLIPQEAANETGFHHLVRVDKHDFADLMQQVHPRLEVEVPNTISRAADTLEAELAFPRLDAFRPEEVARQVPALAQMLTLRTLVRRARDGEIDLEAFRAEMSEAGIDEEQASEIYQTLRRSDASAPDADSASSSKEHTLDRLMGMVDANGEEEPSESDASNTNGPLEALMQAVTASSENRPRADTEAADRILDRLDGLLTQQIQELMTHPDVRRLERAWRGLKFLVDRLDFRSGIHLEVLPVSKEALNGALYHRVLMPEHEGETEKPPLAAIVLDFAFDNSDSDLEQLEDLAEMGASLQVPLIGAASAAFFGVEKMSGLVRLPPLRQHLEGPEYIDWNKLRETKEARHVTLALPSFVLRGPYGPDHPVEAFQFEEEEALWGHPSLAVAAALADSYTRTGWPTHLEGRRLEDLPLWSGPAANIPLAALLPDRTQQELAEAGFLVLSAQPNHDAVRVSHAPTVAHPTPQEKEAAQAEAQAHVSLPCQLFVARAAAALLVIQEGLDSEGSLKAVQQEVERRLRAFLQAESEPEGEEAVSVEHIADANLPDHELLAVRLRPPRTALAPEVSLVMGMQVAVEA